MKATVANDTINVFILWFILVMPLMSEWKYQHNVNKTQLPTSLLLYLSLHMISHCSAHSRGLQIIIGSSVIFAAVITLALVLFIYFGKPQVWIWIGLGYFNCTFCNELNVYWLYSKKSMIITGCYIDKDNVFNEIGILMHWLCRLGHQEL